MDTGQSPTYLSQNIKLPLKTDSETKLTNNANACRGLTEDCVPLSLDSKTGNYVSTVAYRASLSSTTFHEYCVPEGFHKPPICDCFYNCSWKAINCSMNDKSPPCKPSICHSEFGAVHSMPGDTRSYTGEVWTAAGLTLGRNSLMLLSVTWTLILLRCPHIIVIPLLGTFLTNVVTILSSSPSKTYGQWLFQALSFSSKELFLIWSKLLPKRKLIHV